MSTRIYIGNLSKEVDSADVERRFSPYGGIEKLEVKNKLDIDGNVLSKFAYLNLAAGTKLQECEFILLF